MREYRGKSVLSIEELNDKEIPHKNGWVYGWYVDGWIVGNYADSDDEWIAFEWWSQVMPETVGQFTGLYDKNGTPIYEGDVVACVHWFFDGNEVEEHFDAVVGFKDGSFTLENIHSKFYQDYTGYKSGEGICWIGEINYYDDDYEVIGNIHDKAGDE